MPAAGGVNGIKLVDQPEFLCLSESQPIFFKS